MKKFIKAKRITNFKNPVRDEFFHGFKNEARQNFGLDNELCVLIMGGSQGAKSINSAAIGAIKYFKDNKM